MAEQKPSDGTGKNVPQALPVMAFLRQVKNRQGKNGIVLSRAAGEGPLGLALALAGGRGRAATEETEEFGISSGWRPWHQQQRP